MLSLCKQGAEETHPQSGSDALAGWASVTASSLSPGAKAMPAAKATGPDTQMGRKPIGDLDRCPNTEPARQHHTHLCETPGLQLVSGGPAPESTLRPQGRALWMAGRGTGPHGHHEAPRLESGRPRARTSRRPCHPRCPVPWLSAQAAPTGGQGPLLMCKEADFRGCWARGHDWEGGPGVSGCA